MRLDQFMEITGQAFEKKTKEVWVYKKQQHKSRIYRLSHQKAPEEEAKEGCKECAMILQRNDTIGFPVESSHPKDIESFIFNKTWL